MIKEDQKNILESQQVIKTWFISTLDNNNITWFNPNLNSKPANKQSQIINIRFVFDSLVKMISPGASQLAATEFPFHWNPAEHLFIFQSQPVHLLKQMTS